MSKLELDSDMSPEEISAAIAEVTEQDDEDDSCSSRCSELALNCIDLDIATSAVITRLLQSSSSLWKSIEFEECTGRLDILLAIVFCSLKVERIKVTSIYNRLSDSSLFAMALGLQTNASLTELVLSVTLTAEDVHRLLGPSSTTDEANTTCTTTTLSGEITPTIRNLKRLCLWDCNLGVDDDTAMALGQALQSMPLHEFGLVACGQCEDRLSLLLEPFRTSTVLQKLDLRCLASGIGPVVDLLAHNQSLTTLDLSFKSGDEPINVALLSQAIRQHPTLETLHVCQNYLADEDFLLLLEATSLSQTLKTLNVSLNKLTNHAIPQLAHVLSDNSLSLKCLLLDGNPFDDPSPLLHAMLTNTSLEECLIPQELEKSQRLLHYYTRLNRGGCRLVLGNETIPMGLWPLVLERANRLDFDHCANSNGRAEVLYCLLHGPILFPF